MTGNKVVILEGSLVQMRGAQWRRCSSIGIAAQRHRCAISRTKIGSYFPELV